MESSDSSAPVDNPEISDSPPSAETRSQTDPQYENAGEGLAALAVILVVLSFIFLGVGLYRMYNYDDANDKVVGGDAYNYIILGIRGLAFIGIGIASAVISVVCAVFSAAKKATFLNRSVSTVPKL